MQKLRVFWIHYGDYITEFWPIGATVILGGLWLVGEVVLG